MTLSDSRGIGTAALLSIMALAACASGTQGAARTSLQPAPSGQGAAPASQGDAAAAAKAKADSARLPYTPADIHFMSGMIGHHAQAIAMSEWAPTHGASASIRTLAARIINAQQGEIGLMQQWLRDRQQPVPEASAAGMTMMMNGQRQVMLMPGMLTEDQMKQLDAARGPDFDRLFLTFMIQHHRGAVSMVDELFHTYGAGQDEMVFKFASDVNVDQTTEITRMQRMLFMMSLQRSAP